MRLELFRSRTTWVDSLSKSGPPPDVPGTRRIMDETEVPSILRLCLALWWTGVGGSGSRLPAPTGVGYRHTDFQEVSARLDRPG